MKDGYNAEVNKGSGSSRRYSFTTAATELTLGATGLSIYQLVSVKHHLQAYFSSKRRQNKLLFQLVDDVLVP